MSRGILTSLAQRFQLGRPEYTGVSVMATTACGLFAAALVFVGIRRILRRRTPSDAGALEPMPQG